MTETADNVFRDFNTPGVPASGEYKPEKALIRALLRGLEQGYLNGYRLNFSTTTADADPGAGVVRFSSGTFGSITYLYIDNADAFGNSLTTFLDGLDDVVNANARAYLRLQEATDPSVYAEFAVTGAVVDGTGYRKVPVSPIGGAVPADTTALVMTATKNGADAVGLTAATSTVAAYGDFAEATNNGSNKVRVTAPVSLAADATVTLPSVSGVLALATFNNPILNPDMDVCQGATSVVSPGDGIEMIDRWTYNTTLGALHTISRDTDVPSLAQAGRIINYSYKLNLTTPDNSIAAGDHLVIVQKLEGTRFKNIAQQALTMRFWVKSTITGTFSVSLRNGASDLSCVGQITINAANTWEQKTVTFPATPSSGTWVYDNSGAGLRIGIVLVAGSNYQTGSAGAWVSGAGGFHALSGQTNFVATGATNFWFTGVELFPSTYAGCFLRSFDEEIALCRRYRRVFTGLANNSYLMQGVSISASVGYFIVNGMRAVTAVTYSGTPKLREEGVGTSNLSSAAVVDAIEGHSIISATCGGGLTTDRPITLASSATTDVVTVSSVF